MNTSPRFDIIRHADHEALSQAAAARLAVSSSTMTLPMTCEPAVISGSKVGPILYKNVTMNGAVVRNAEDLARAGLDISVPVKFEP